MFIIKSYFRVLIFLLEMGYFRPKQSLSRERESSIFSTVNSSLDALGGIDLIAVINQVSQRSISDKDELEL
jgi:hypothetical protein